MQPFLGVISKLIKKGIANINGFCATLRTKSLFWKMRNKYLFFKFYILKLIFLTQEKIQNSKRNFATSKSIAKDGGELILKSIFLVVFTQYCGKILNHFLPHLKELVQYVGGHLHDLAPKLWIFCTYIKIKVLSESYLLDAIKLPNSQGLIAGISAFTGVLLGLYFTVISVGVGQNFYSLHPALKEIILSERYGNRYLKHLSILTLYSFLLWFHSLYGQNITNISLLITVFYMMYVVVGITKVGKRAFNLASPHTLSETPLNEIFDSLNRLAKQDMLCKQQSFEIYLRKKTKNAFSSIRHILGYAFEKKDKGVEDVSYIINNLFHSWLKYRSFKQSLNSESEWYETIYKHEDWLYPNFTKEQLLQDFGVIPEPEKQKDTLWFENEIISIFFSSIKEYLHNSMVPEATSLLRTAESYVQNQCRSWDISASIRFLHEIETLCLSTFDNSNISQEKRLGLIDTIGQLKVLFIIELGTTVRELDINKCVEIPSLSCQQNLSVNMCMPNSVRSTYDYLLDRLDVEKKIESHLVSPPWYIKQLLARQWGIGLNEMLKEIANVIQPPYQNKNVDGLILRTASIQRNIELLSRLNFLRSDFENIFQNLKQFEIIPDLEIPSVNFTFLVEAQKKKIAQNYETLADCLVPLFSKKRDQGQLDFFGIAYRQLVKETYNILKNNESDRFENIFKKLFIGSLLAIDRMNFEYKNENDPNQTNFKISLEPILDILTLSGYSYAYSEYFHNQKYMEVVHNTWNNFLSGHSKFKTVEELLKWLITIYNITSHQFSVTNTSHIRDSWNQDFLDLLKRENYISERDHFSFYQSKKPTTKPTTPLLKLICYGSFLIRERPVEWFLTQYSKAENITEEQIENFDASFFKNYPTKENEETEDE